MQVQPYLSFDGRCEEAIEFYKRAIGAEVLMLMRFKESPEPCPQLPPGFGDKVMHSSLQIGSSVVMMTDGMGQGHSRFDGFSLSLTLSNEAQVERAFAALSEGGSVGMPLTKTFFSSRFGMLKDRFGVSWMVLVEPKM